MYLAVSGNIGSGKSTLTRLLSERLKLTPVFETVDENPYLADFYQDMARYAFHSQVFFLSKRLEQHLKVVNHTLDVVQDRTIFEDAWVFARNLYQQGHMSLRDWETYQSLLQGILPALRMPDVLIHIEASLPTLKKRIGLRGRDYEKALPDQYLLNLSELYDTFIGEYTASKVYILNGDALDFVERPEIIEKLCDDIDDVVVGGLF